MTLTTHREIGADRERRDGPAKVTGTAPYAAEHPFDDPVYAHAVQASIAKGTVTSVDTTAADRVPGVLAILSHDNAERLRSGDDLEFFVLQTPDVAFRGQFAAVAVATSAEAAREAAEAVVVGYDEAAHDVVLRDDHPELYAPDVVNPSFPTDSSFGDVDAGLAAADTVLDVTYGTPMEHNNPMEPHTTVATWDVGNAHLTLHDSTQSAHDVADTIAPLFGLEPDQVTVVNPHVGGGFGSKGAAKAHDVLAALCARALPGRSVKLALPRQALFAIGGHRTPTIQRVRLAADADGRLRAITHDVVEWTATIKEFAEQTALATRTLYATPACSTSHRLAPLDVPVPAWMRAPGEHPGMFGLESAMDELATLLGIDPIELRVRNEPDVEPGSGKPFSSRNLVACLRDGAQRFGWDADDRGPGPRRVGNAFVGTGVAASTYPVNRMPGTEVVIDVLPDGRYRVATGAVDIGQGTWTSLAQVAADALGVPFDDVELQIGDSALPKATVAGGSSGITSWGTAVVDAARTLRDQHGHHPDAGVRVTGSAGENEHADDWAMHAYGAQFAEVRVDADTGEVRVPRLLGVFAAGRIVNPRLARSQLVGGMTMGLSTALFEESTLDPVTGHVVNHDLAQYHVASHADVPHVEAHWIEEDDDKVNPMGTKGIGEIGIVGTTAAIANAVHHAIGIRVRDLPITPDKLLLDLPD